MEYVVFYLATEAVFVLIKVIAWNSSNLVLKKGITRRTNYFMRMRWRLRQKSGVY